jgi:two-component system, sensor histidine kinase and response regulator
MTTTLDRPIMENNPSTAQQHPPKARVLIVDDEYMVGKSIQELLDFLGFQCEFIQNGKEAIQYLADHLETDIVLLDINLGMEISGIELLPILKQKNKYAQFIMFTSEDKLEVGVECMRKGAYDYMTKPFDEQAFQNKVPGALERKKVLQLNDLYLGILFHDLKNPLQGIMGGLELLRMSLPETGNNDLMKNAFNQTDTSIKQILLMINNIVSISKFENNAFSARREKFILQREVASALAPFNTPSLDDGDQKLTIGFPSENDILLETDKDLFVRVLTNIVSNAVRYSSNGFPVKVEFVQKDITHLHTMVTNTGSYIEDSARESIFNKFSSVELPASHSAFKNFGLGLTFSKMAIDAMEGTIWIECDRELPSTTFHFIVRNYINQACS